MRQRKNDQEDTASRNIGIGGVSLEEFMAQFNESLEPDHTIETSLSQAEEIEIVTNRDGDALHLEAEDEVRQQLQINRSGTVVFRSLKYFKGKGHYSIGRYETVQITSGTVREIYHLLDAWLFVCQKNPWVPEENAGSWFIRARHEDGPVEMERGSLAGAFVDGIDVSGFIRARVPVTGLFLFDPY